MEPESKSNSEDRVGTGKLQKQEQETKGNSCRNCNMPFFMVNCINICLASSPNVLASGYHVKYVCMVIQY